MPVLRTHQPLTVQEQSYAALHHQFVAVIPVTAKTQKAALVGPGCPGGQINQQVPLHHRREEQLAAADKHIGATVIPGADGRRHGEITLAFILNAGRPLAPGSVKDITGEPNLGTENVLIQFVLLKSEAVFEGKHQAVQIEGLPCHGDFQTVVPVQSRAGDRERVIVHFGPAERQRAAPLFIAGVTSQKGPGDQATTGTAFNGSDTSGRPDPAADVGHRGLGYQKRQGQGYEGSGCHSEYSGLRWVSSRSRAARDRAVSGKSSGATGRLR